jgi:hypothetical protein
MTGPGDRSNAVADLDASRKINAGESFELLFACGVLQLPFYGNLMEDSVAGTKNSGASSGSKRGFAAMDPAKQREIASKGGKASHGGGRPSTRASSSR